ncbi:hypothetical protein QUF72_17730 [Desulfobacterales bacterium HSG2]|nr:hypothetical protein [Desulfobacterales bacterium HSG2]
MTDNRSLIHQLLYHALIDIREAACEGNSRAAFRLSDLIHTIPLQLERVRKEGGDYAEILNGLRERARQKGCESWINNALRHYAKPYESVSETGYSGQRGLQAEDAELVQIV